MSGPAVGDQASILVVDDNPLIVNVLKGLFSSVDYQVFSCNNGSEAVDMLGSKEVDVIICDVMMPKMGGYELHDFIRDKSEFSHIPFVFLTALDDPREIRQGKSSGADDYMVKPFDPEELLSMVQGKVKRSRKLRNLSQEQYDAFRKRIIHTLSHEFRTPLVAINTGTELLLTQKDGVADEKVSHLLEAIQRGGMRLEKLVNDFMLMQQIEAGIAQRLFDSRASEVAVGDVVLQFVESCRVDIESSGGKLTFSDKSSESRIKIYEPQVLDVLKRLVDNAVKFSPSDPDIELMAYRQEKEAVIEVRDGGIGIDEKQVREAVDLFGQINREKVEQQGGGLGLAICNRYAVIHGGRLEFEKRAEGGSTVSLILPISNY